MKVVDVSPVAAPLKIVLSTFLSSSCPMLLPLEAIHTIIVDKIATAKKADEASKST